MNGWMNAIQLNVNVNDDAQLKKAAAKSEQSRSSASLWMIPLVDQNVSHCCDSSQIQIEYVLREDSAAS